MALYIRRQVYDSKINVSSVAISVHVYAYTLLNVDGTFSGTRRILFQVRIESHDGCDADGKFRQAGRKHGKNFHNQGR